VTTPDHAAAAQREILERHQRWFDSFERGDRATMASLVSDNFSLVDQRPERAPAASGRVERTIQDLRVQVTETSVRCCPHGSPRRRQPTARLRRRLPCSLKCGFDEGRNGSL
jgi:hypothetical protein